MLPNRQSGFNIRYLEETSLLEAFTESQRPFKIVAPYGPAGTVFITACEKDTLLGYAKMLPGENHTTLSYFEVDPARRNEGIGKCLLKYVFRHAMESHGALAISPYTSLGYRFLWPTENHLAKQFPELTIARHQPC